MELVALTAHAYHLRAGANAGLLVQGGRGLLVDTGLDRDAARRILKHTAGLGVELAAVIVTHAHADHFGGAGEIHRRTGAVVWAPPLEAAIVENPLLEPLYLFAGAQPTAELRGKFILAQPCPVGGLLDPGPMAIAGFELEIIPMPGHAHNQMIVGWPAEGVCFAADAFFPPEVLDKHGIPFYVDVDQALASLEALARLPYRLFAQGHGDAYTAEALPEAVAVNAQRIRRVRELTLAALERPCTDAEALAYVADALGLAIVQPAIYYLARTTVHACLNSLRQAGQAELALEGNRLLWRSLA
ncbi:MAG: MBL fold metallo-hydrolase [Caldilineales bacterium]|nr:MBL fold metallo-hydrolase [Caldilineales bacterium]MDW8317529.1 MBL fold metallo-hydrolase [Anaerolineae bacterium]